MCSAISASVEFNHWWNAAGDWVEEPNERRGGTSGVKRARAADGAMIYVKLQTGHLYRSLSHPLGRPTVLREADALRALQALGVTVPSLVFCGARREQQQWRAVLATRALEGYLNLADWYGSAPDAQQRAALTRELARALARMHRGRWQHGCLYAKHIFVRNSAVQGEVDVALLDLEKARRRPLPYLAARRDLAQLDRHRGSMPDADWRELVQWHQRLLRAP